MKDLQELPEFSEIKEIVNNYDAKRENLLSILGEIQNRKNSISKEAQQIVAELLRINPVEVYSTVNFYFFYNDKPKGEIEIRLCKNVSCKLAGADDIRKAIERKLAVKPGESTEDGKFSFEEINCFGNCDNAPSVMINRELYSHVTPEKIENLINKFAESKK